MHNALTFGYFTDAQKVANYLICNQMPFYFTATRTEAPGFNIIYTWDSDLEWSKNFCQAHAITCQACYIAP